MSAPQGGASAPPADVVRRTQRPHPASPLIRGWIVVVGLAVFFAREFLSAEEEGRRAFNPLEWGSLVVVYVIAAVLALILVLMFASWHFTRFVIDESELRLESGVVFRQSRRIPFTKVQSVEVIQPFAARMFGLAELVIDAGAASPTRLRYLRRDEAYRFRDYLLVRAHGVASTLAETSPHGSLLQDVGGSDQVITRIHPGALIAAAVLSPEVYLTLIVVGAATVVPTVLGLGWVAPAAVLGLLLSSVGFINKVALTQFNYVLARSGQSLKITRGLTSLTSHTLPPRRVQALKIVQAWAWRPLGLYRVEMDILGGHDSDGEEGGASRSKILMPAGRRTQVDLALTALWPHAEPSRVPLQGSPRRARWLRPVTAPTLRYGADDVLAVTAHGFFRREQFFVPHRRVQSVRIVQGPLQRRLRLADVQIHTVGGVISMVAKHLDPGSARAFTEREAAQAVQATSDGTAPVPLATPVSAGAGAPVTEPPAPDPASALGWPHPADEPHAGLGFPHLPWR